MTPRANWRVLELHSNVMLHSTVFEGSNLSSQSLVFLVEVHHLPRSNLRQCKYRHLSPAASFTFKSSAAASARLLREVRVRRHF
jgi:hypothetical protein